MGKKTKKIKHIFNYNQLKEGQFSEDKIKQPNRQMRTVWSIPTPKKEEKEFGKHPTQKPLALINRIVLSSTNEGDVILDPFNGSGTTGVAAKLANRNYIGIDNNKEYIELTKKRLMKIINNNTFFKKCKNTVF